MQRVVHAQDVAPDIFEAIRFERHDIRPAVEPGTDRFDDVALADRAYLALRLRDDDVGSERAERLGVHAVDRQRLLQDGPDALVDLVTGTLDVELRLGADGEALDRFGKVALMR